MSCVFSCELVQEGKHVSVASGAMQDLTQQPSGTRLYIQC